MLEIPLDGSWREEHIPHIQLRHQAAVSSSELDSFEWKLLLAGRKLALTWVRAGHRLDRKRYFNEMNDEYSKVMEAIANTYCAILTPTETSILQQHADVDTVKYAQYQASGQQGGREMYELLAKSCPQQLHSLNVVLYSLTTIVGTQMLCPGRLCVFVDRNRAEREASLKAWAVSCIPQLRTVHKIMYGVSCLYAYGIAIPNHPLWNVIDYTERLRASSGWTPTFLDTEQLLNSKTPEYDVIVVGSGAGGGVVAAELSAAGFRVLILDKATYTSPKDLPLTEKASFELLFERNGFLGSKDGGVQLLAGTAWGGGTAVNWSASLQLPEKVRKEWIKEHGLDFASTSVYKNATTAVQTRLGISTANISHNIPNQILLDGCRKIGIIAEDIPQNTGGHVHECGWCTFGCPYNEKQSSMVTWIRDAMEAGCHLLAGCHADSVHQKNGLIVGVNVVLKGRKLLIKAKRVVISCGSIHSPALLLRSKIRNKNIGRNLSVHPALTVTGVFKKPTSPNVGSIMTAITNIDADQDGKGYGCKIEVPIGHPAVTANLTPWKSCLDHKIRMVEYGHSSSLVVIARDKDSSGTVSIDGNGEPVIDWTLGPQDAKHITASIETSIRILFAAGALSVRTSQSGILELQRPIGTLSEVFESPSFQKYLEHVHKVGVVQTVLQYNKVSSIFSAHQMGTNRMGVDRSTCVVRPTGESYDVRGMYIADASIFPTASGANPMMTTTTLAYIVAQSVKKDLLGVSSNL